MCKGRWAVILNGLVRMDFTENMICEERFEVHERVNHVDTWAKNMLTEGTLNLEALSQECVCWV